MELIFLVVLGYFLHNALQYLALKASFICFSTLYRVSLSIPLGSLIIIVTSYLVFPAPGGSRAAESASQTWPRTLAAAGAGPVAGAGLGCPGGRSGQSPLSARGQSRARGQAGTSASQRQSPPVTSEMKINVCCNNKTKNFSLRQYDTV